MEFLCDFFTEEGSYQGLKDATSFGLLSDKSAELLGSKYSNFCQISILADSAIFGLCGHGLNRLSDITCMSKGSFGMKISLEIVTFGQCDHDFFLACSTGANRFEYSLSNYSAITQSNA